MNPNEATVDSYVSCAGCERLILLRKDAGIRAEVLFFGKEKSSAVGAYFCSADCLTAKVKEHAERVGVTTR